MRRALRALFLVFLASCALGEEASTFNVKFSDPRPQGSAPPVQDDLSYQVMHMIKGSYTAVGPLQVGCVVMLRVSPSLPLS